MKWFLQTLKSLVPLWRASMTAGDKSPHEVDLADDMLAAWDWETICGNETGSELSHVHALARQLGDRALPFSGPQSPATIRCMAEAIGSTLYGVQLEIEASFARMSGQFPLAEPWGDPADNVIHLCGAYVGERLHVHLLRGHLLSRWWARWQLARAYEE